MPSIEDAQNRLENNLGDAGSKYRSGVQNPERSPAEGIDDEYDIDNFDEETQEEFNNHWENKADSDDAENKLENSADRAAEKWASNWGDADNWVIGGDEDE